MGLSKVDEKELQDRFEDQLTRVGLGKNQIENYALPELEQCLVTLNELIANPAGLYAGEPEPTTSMARIWRRKSEEDVLAVLLERKKWILDRISLQRQQRKITGLRELVNEQVLDPEARTRLIDEIDKLEADAHKQREQTARVEQALAEERVKREQALTNVEVFKQRSKVWLTFLERESVATIAGAILLFTLAITLIVATFVGVETTEILNNAFLLILGYFFGQTASRPSSRASE